MSDIKGIDVSSWQGDIDWKKVKAAGIEFTMIRACKGTKPDLMFEKNIRGAMEQGISCGVYLYSIASTKAEAILEAKAIIAMIKPYEIVYPVAFDIEDIIQHGLTDEVRTDLVESFCKEIKGAGYHTCMYTSLSWITTMFQLTRLETIDKWVAQWSGSQPKFEATSLWQYSSKGKIDGIAGDVDLDISYKSYKKDIPKSPEPTKEVKPQQQVKVDKPADKSIALKAGTKLVLKSDSIIYMTADSDKKAKVISGNYWIYDGKEINGRIRITNSMGKVNQLPVGDNVTGFIEIKEAQKLRI